MTANRDPDRLLRAWLDLMPDEAPDRVIDSVLSATTAASQARIWPWEGPRRFQAMNRLVYLGAAAILIVVLAGGALIFKPTLNNGSVPTPTPSLTPPAATAPPAASHRECRGPHRTTAPARATREAPGSRARAARGSRRA